MISKLKQQLGETLVETLVSLLIATLSVMMLTAAITGSARINSRNREADITYTRELKRAESYDTSDYPAQTTYITIDFNGSKVDKEVRLFGGTDGKFTSYKAVEDEVSP